MKIAIVTINDPSLKSAKKLLPYLDGNDVDIFNKTEDRDNFHTFKKLDDILPTAWKEFDAIICLLAMGAVVRKIAPFLQDKSTDPAVLVMTLDLKRVVPLLSGHLGGANELANMLSKKIDGCINFVTTASDQIDVFAFDMFAKKYGYEITNLKSLAEVANTIINNKQVQVVTYPCIVDEIKAFTGYKEQHFKFVMPDSFEQFEEDMPTVYITPQKLTCKNLQIHPTNIVLGLGMNRGTSEDEIANSVKRFCYEHSIEFQDISKLASFNAKADEVGLLKYAKSVGLDIEFFSEEDINSLTQNFSPSQATKFFNIKGVAEPASLLASEHKTLFLSKRIYGAVTVAASF